ncbi:MAG TPA: endopeptidase La [Planctomycetota bacterium]|jgi:ATP-dependent Lon protease|nr:endopeptidase La [Planctomycetota bacterium]
MSEPTATEAPPEAAAPPEQPSAGVLVQPVVKVEEEYPETLFVFPLRRAVGFPDLLMPVVAEAGKPLEILEKARAQSEFLCLVLRRDPEGDGTGPADLHKVGVLVRLLKVVRLPDGNASAVCQGLKRVVLERMLRVEPYPIARCRILEETNPGGEEVEALVRNVRKLLRSIVEKTPSFGEEFSMAALNIDAAGRLADFAAAYFIRDAEKKQKVLETTDVRERLRFVDEALTVEEAYLELGERIQKEIREKVEKAQKEYFLREQLKIIRRELGEEKDRATREREEFAARIARSGMPPEVERRAKEELDRLGTVPTESAEYPVVRNALELMVSLPWSTVTEDRADLSEAARVLDADHYGLEEVKERILEFLGVRKIREGHRGPILCFVGPPGVGKTSLGQSIARATGRKFTRLSVGGMRDEAEIKGHRRTYVGAMPGRILQGIRNSGAANPVFMLDELDKIGKDFRGDPAAALLEVLDPEQNRAFLDEYLDVPFDLSRVMFVGTANVLEGIPWALRDRMEVIEIPGYVVEEKVEIALRHLLPKEIENHGLAPGELHFSRAILRRIVEGWTREAGVRALEQSIAKICRRRAVVHAKGGRPRPLAVDEKHLREFLGPPRYEGEDRRASRPGIAPGLAWTGYGGDILYVEAARWPGKGGFSLTGRLGEVMEESARLAANYVRSHAGKFGVEPAEFEKFDVHVHFPSGAVPKDGPSAGVAIATALLSLLRNEAVAPGLAMTGELTLLGEVLPVGGIREKVLVARRFGLKTVILPESNRPDVEELEKRRPELVRGLHFVFVGRYEDLFPVAFPRARSSKR